MTNKDVVWKRFGQAALTMYTVISLTFVLVRLMPGGPMQYLRSQFAQQGNMDPERINTLMQVYVNIHPDKPLLTQYVNYLIAVSQGDLGKSVWYSKPVATIIAEAAPWTLFLLGTATFITFSIGIVAGAVIAYNEGSNMDTTATLTGMFLTSVPYYILAVIFVYILGYQLNWFPTGGRFTEGTTPGLNWAFIAGVIEHGALPIASIVVTEFGGWMLGMRGNSIRVLGEDYLRVARLRGLPDSRISMRYVGRNAVLPLYTGFVIAIGFLFGGSVILEQVFTYPGLGYYLYQAVSARDYPLMMGCFLLITFAVVIGVLVADLTYDRIDPRAGGEGSREAY